MVGNVTGFSRGQTKGKIGRVEEEDAAAFGIFLSVIQ